MASIFQLPKAVAMDGSESYPGAKLEFFLTGTVTNTDTYSDSSLSTPHSNPVVADANGVFPTIYLDPDITYKLTYSQSDDTLIYTVDPVSENLTQSNIGKILYPQTSAESTAGVTPTDYEYEPGDIRRLNAVGDDSTDNATAIQNAFTYSASSGFPVFDKTGGTYQTGTALTNTGGRVVFKGAGIGRTIFKDSGSNVDFLDASQPVEFYDCTFDGYTNIIEFVESSTITDISFIRCEFKNCTKGIYAAESTSVGLQKVKIIDCKFHDVDQYAIQLENETLEDVTITGCDFYTIGTTGTAIAIQLGNNTEVSVDKNTYFISNNNFRDITTTHATAETHAILVYAITGKATIVGNIIENVSNGGTAGCEGIYTKCQYATIIGNVLEDGGKHEAAINIKGDTRAGGQTGPLGYGVTCIGNVVKYRDFTGTLGGINVNNENCIIQGNYIENATSAAISGALCHNSIIDGNIIHGGDLLHGIEIDAAEALEGVRITNNVIEGIAYDDTGLSVGIEVQNAQASGDLTNVVIRGNTIRNNSFVSGTFRGVMINGSDDGFADVWVEDNHIEEATIGVVFTGNAGGSATGVRYRNNTFGSSVTTKLSLAIAPTFAAETTVYAEVETLADDSTPSVANGKYFVTGGTTSITDFDDGQVGQTILIRSAHSITITDGSPIELNGGANFAMAAGDTLTLHMFTDQVWTEIARSDNTP